MLHALIMAGGEGTRFWPLSRQERPKQFLKLVGRRSLLQQTFDRLQGLADRLVVATNARFVPAVREQLPELPEQAIIGEPYKRDTAPCIGLVAGLIRQEDPEAVLVVLPADHVIRPVDEFQAAVQDAVAAVKRDHRLFVTFGIPPTYPATTYGYIERGAPLTTTNNSTRPLFQVSRFREKPSRQVAERFLEAGTFYWNAGIFVWKAETIWNALCEYEPAMAAHLEAILAAADSADFPNVFAEHFEKITPKSIDYAVMEKYPHTAVIAANFAWDDLGNWQSLQRVHGVDEHGNCTWGKNLVLDTEHSIIWTDDGHLVVLLGMRDTIVAHTPDATLVAHRQAEESLREVVRRLREQGWAEYL